MSRNLYRVAVKRIVNGRHPQKDHLLVIAESAHDALDKASDVDDIRKLYDEPIQRAIVGGEISDHRVERKYSGYIEEVDVVGDLK